LLISILQNLKKLHHEKAHVGVTGQEAGSRKKDHYETE
jgi:hypothetical protein